jgi:hypothetical protein
MNLNFLRGLFGSSVRQAYGDQPDIRGTYRINPDANPALAAGVVESMGGTGAIGGDVGPLKRPPVAVGNPERSYLGGLVKYQRPEGQTDAERAAIFGAMLSDVGSSLRGGEGGSLARVQAEFRKRAAEAESKVQAQRLKALAGQLYADDPEAQMLFLTDPESFVKARAERLKPQTLSGGQTYVDPATGQHYTAPSVEKFDDRFGYYDPRTGEARFSDPRGPTYQEETGRMGQQETGRHNRAEEAIGQGNLGVAQGHLGVARAKEGREAGGAGLESMSVDELLAALRR